ncbi:MAG: MFS transporter [Alphaproteobacteria bacterium]
MANEGERDTAPAGKLRVPVTAWCFYDWGNSAIPAIILTFLFAPYFTQAVAADPVTGSAQWGQTLTLSALLIAVLSPILGTFSDKAGRRKPWLGFFSLVAMLAVASMWFVRPSVDDVLLALVLLAIANLGFELAVVFYNSMLPALVPRHLFGRVSGWGWGAGYAGGLICLAIALLWIVQPETPPFGLDKEMAEHVRAVTPLAAIWFAVFALPLFLFTPDEPRTGLPFGKVLREGLVEVLHTLRTVRHHPSVAWYLLAHMIYIDGINTLFLFGGIYAAGTFQMNMVEVLQFGIALNVTAGIGAAAFAWLDDWIGAKRVITIALVSLTITSVAILFTEDKTWFWGLGLVLGIFFGPVQSASRSLMARLAPEGMHSQMFGLYSLTGKATAFLGPAFFSFVVTATGSQRAGMATILPFFLIGLLLLLKVRE